MTRVFLTIILPLVLPTALYVLWTVGMSRLHADPGLATLRDLPWLWLAGAGFVLACAILAAAVELGGTRDGVYVPPHLEHGAIVPGHVVPGPSH
jgi:Family of unknown function (DUF6111)